MQPPPILAAIDPNSHCILVKPCPIRAPNFLFAGGGVVKLPVATSWRFDRHGADLGTFKLTLDGIEDRCELGKRPGPQLISSRLQLCSPPLIFDMHLSQGSGPLCE
jgi:hypothetical protein